ncbi:MAG: ParB N-terminal domain-containing protein [Bacteroidales bacterium]|nr:ParB N-terminal domain-containing protein [Bacteroidales bacterium]
MDTTLSGLRLTRPGEIEKMCRRLSQSGQLNPVIVRSAETGFQILDGFKRFFSAQRLGWEYLDAGIVDVPLANGKAMMLSYNRGGRSLLDYDEALVVQSLKRDHLLDQTSISRLTGYSRSWVCRRLALVEKLDPIVQDSLRMEVITNSHARAIVRLPRGNQGEVMRCIADNQLTSRDSVLLVEKFLESPHRKDQQYILSHAKEVIEKSVSEVEIYDIRLGRYGNRLLKSIELLYLQQNIFIGLCTGHMSGKLSGTETEILDHKMEKLKKGTFAVGSIINQKTWKDER